MLHEVSPNHWVGLWRTKEVAGRPTRPPDLNFRKPEMVAQGVA
jgi:hypothetical protein